MEDNYGLTPTKPIKLNSIGSSCAFFEHLISTDYQLITYKRNGSIKPISSKFPIDHYQVTTRNGDIFNIYIDIYNDENLWVPPDGFKFLSDLIFYVDDDFEVQVDEIEPQYVIENECFENFVLQCLIKRISLN